MRSFRTTKNFRFPVGLLIFGVFIASANAAPSRVNFSFPAKVGVFKLHEKSRDPYGFPQANYRAGSLGYADVFYYQNKSNSLAPEYAGARDEIKIKTPNAKMLIGEHKVVSLGGRRHEGYRAVFDLKMSGAPRTRSYLFAFELGEYFLFFRIEAIPAHIERMDKEIDRFIAEFPDHNR